MTESTAALCTAGPIGLILLACLIFMGAEYRRKTFWALTVIALAIFTGALIGWLLVSL